MLATIFQKFVNNPSLNQTWYGKIKIVNFIIQP